MTRFLDSLFVSLSIMILSPMPATAEGKNVPVSKLPAEARSFIKSHYDSVKILQVFFDRTDYEVLLAGNIKLEFDRNGNWKEILCHSGSIPDAIIPTRIQAYINESYPAEKVCTMDRNRWGYEVKTTSGLKLKFDKNCNFVRIED